MCAGCGTLGAETSKRPVMPRWIRNSLRPPSSRMTTVLPTRCTRSIFAPVSTSAISGSGDLKVCGLPLVHTAEHALPVHALVHAVRDSLNLGKLRHRSNLKAEYKMKHGREACFRQGARTPTRSIPEQTVSKQRQSAVILGAQWGDEGKGKIVDVLSEKFDIVARYAGGHNAGHTVIIHGRKFVLQLIPCGVLRPGCKGVIGNGVVLDPAAFLNEVRKLREAGLPVDGQLFVSDRAQVILPYHRMIELAAETAPGRQPIGTTRRGIGPAYEDKMHRNGLRVADLLNTRLLRTHIQNACHEKNTIAHALFGTEPLDPRAMYEEYAKLAEQVAPFVTDTAVMLNEAIDAGQNVMFEGAQGALLDIDHGTYPFVTSSSCDRGRRGHRNGRRADEDRHRDRRYEGLRDARGRRAVSDRDRRSLGRAAAGARAGVRRGDRAAAALRLAGPAAAALLEHDQRDGMAGGDQDGRDG